DPFRIGHEFVGIVEEVGSDVRSLRKGEFVIAPFMYSDNTCPHCRVGIQSACSAGGFWGGPDRDGLTAAGVEEGDTVVVVGDGAVGLSGVLAASRMGAERVVTMSRHEERQQIARSFGATGVIAERGEAG